MMILFNQEVVGDMKGELLELMQVATNLYKIKDDLYIFTICWLNL